MQSTLSSSVIQVTAYVGNYVNKEISILVNLAIKMIFLKTTWDLFNEEKDTFFSIFEKVHLGMLSSL